MDAKELLRCYAQGQREFRNTPLVNLDLEGVDLSDAKFLSGIENSNFKGACLRGIYCSVKNSNFEGADLSKARFSSIKNSNFKGADLSDARLDRIEDSNFRRACLKEASISEGTFERCDLEDATLEGAVILAFLNTNLKRANLNGCRFMSEGTIQNCNFEGATLKNAQMIYFTIENSNFRNADLQGMTGNEIYFMNVDFRGIRNFVSPTFTETQLHHTILPDGRLAVVAYLDSEGFGKL